MRTLPFCVEMIARLWTEIATCGSVTSASALLDARQHDRARAA